MTKSEANEILKTDKISEDDSGFYMIPGRRVHIYSDNVKDEDASDRAGDISRNLEWKKAHLFGFVGKGNWTYSNYTSDKYFITNFYVRFEHDIWMRNFFDDALEVIEALQTIYETTDFR